MSQNFLSFTQFTSVLTISYSFVDTQLVLAHTCKKHKLILPRSKSDLNETVFIMICNWKKNTSNKNFFIFKSVLEFDNNHKIPSG